MLAGGLAAGAAAFVAAAGSATRVGAQSPIRTPEPTPAATGDGSFAGVHLEGFSGGYSLHAEAIGLAAWNAATGGNATFTNVPFTEKPAVIAAIISTEDSNWDTIYTSDNFMARFGARLLRARRGLGARWTSATTTRRRSRPTPPATACCKGLPIHYSGFLSGYNKDLFAKIGARRRHRPRGTS